jgi:hypothetical protein
VRCGINLEVYYIVETLSAVEEGALSACGFVPAYSQTTSTDVTVLGEERRFLMRYCIPNPAKRMLDMGAGLGGVPSTPRMGLTSAAVYRHHPTQPQYALEARHSKGKLQHLRLDICRFEKFMARKIIKKSG